MRKTIQAEPIPECELRIVVLLELFAALLNHFNLLRPELNQCFCGRLKQATLVEHSQSDSVRQSTDGGLFHTSSIKKVEISVSKH